MPRDAVHAQLREALRVVVHVVRRGGHRFVDRVGVVVADQGPVGTVRVVEAASSGERGLVAGPGRRGWCSWCPALAERCRWVEPC